MLLTNILDALPLPAAIFDRDGRCLRINRRLTEVSARSADWMVGERVQDVVPELAPKLQSCIASVYRDGAVLRQQVLSGWPSESASGGRVWHAEFSPLRDDEGQMVGVLMVSHEVTGQVERERTLSDDAAHLRRVLDGLFSFVCVLLPDGTLVEANRAPLQAAGLAWGDVIGRRFWDCRWWDHDPALRERCRDSVLRAAAGETVRFDAQLRMAGDALMDIDYMIAPLIDGQGRITHLIPSGTDITSRVRTEQGLSRSERRFRELFESAPLGLAVVADDGRMVAVNAQLERMTGHDRTDLVGSPVQRLIPDRFGGAHAAHMRAYWDRPQTRPMAERILWVKRRDGSEFPVEAGLTPVPSEHGRQVLVTLTDCSQREAAKAQLEGALREKTDLLNEVHHRVKNNLQVVSSLLNVQMRTVPNEAKQALSAAQGRMKAMALIHQLLYEGRDYAQIDLTLYVQRLVRLLRESLLPTGQPIQLLAPAGQAPIWLDLQRAVPCGLLINELVTNALKHAFADGRSGVVEVRLERVDGEARLTVRDDGVGLPEGVSVDGGGSGLGLQLVPLLAQQLGARMQVLRDGGCLFQLDFAAQGAS